MVASAATRGGEGRSGKRVPASELPELLDRTLTELDRDERLGPLIRATGMRLRLECPDVGLVLNVAASDSPDRHIRWAFSDDVDWEPRLELQMASDVANAYLQGKESLAVAIARGKVRCKGESRIALLYVPATRLIVEPYRRVVRDLHPDLVLT
ncbi:MAG TPA: hypothetical protein VHJ54_09815 [Solirubrobacterales bacterium]|jgi:hypothetical protein|nr:hypothetical protein [Solirubrobacterales bacterium]